LPTIRGDITHESDRIRDSEFENHLILRETDEAARYPDLLSRFLDIPPEKAQDIAALDHLFAD
jgi:hypothetical protein